MRLQSSFPWLSTTDRLSRPRLAWKASRLRRPTRPFASFPSTPTRSGGSRRRMSSWRMPSTRSSSLCVFGATCTLGALTTPSIADLRARRRLHHLLRLGDDLPPHRLPRPPAARRGKTVVSETAATSPGRQHLDPRPRRARAGDVLGAGPDGAQVACRHDCEGVPPRVRAAAKGDGSASSALLGT